MNDTRVIQTNTRSDVRAFVARVRVALSDLPDDDADELTQGMEADLVELAAEAGGLRGRLGTPEAYADDLRAAADLPPRQPAPTRGRRRVLTRVAGWWARGERLMDRAWVRDLRPVGWALRGVVAYCVAASVIGANPHSLLGWLVGASFSFWVGRSTRTWANRPRTLLITVNVLAALIGVFAVPSAFGQTSNGTEYVEVPTTIDGLAVDGEPVTGIVVYDSSGRRIEQPRAFDQNGSPLLPAADGATYTPPAFLPPLPPLPPGPSLAPSPTVSGSMSPPVTSSQTPPSRTGTPTPTSPGTQTTTPR